MLQQRDVVNTDVRLLTVVCGIRCQQKQWRYTISASEFTSFRIRMHSQVYL